MNIALVLIGFVILAVAAEALVDGSVAMAHRIGVSPLVIGLTVVALGTSMPELVVSILASFDNNPGIAVGNAVGSSIFNAAFILGVTALIHPIRVEKSVIRRDVPIMIGASLLAWWFASGDLLITRGESLFLLLGIVVYTGLSYLWGVKKGETAAAASIPAVEGIPLPRPHSTGSKEAVLIVAGLGGMIAGSRMLLVGAVAIAKNFGLSDEIIGLTLVALGTSLPELATSVMSARKGQSEIAIGNVVGSNIFNIFGILGCAGILLPLKVSPHMLGIDIPIMVVVNLGCLPIMWTGQRISRFEGGLLLATYVGYTILLLLAPG